MTMNSHRISWVILSAIVLSSVAAATYTGAKLVNIPIQTLPQNTFQTDGGLDPLFNAGNITNGEVNAAILQPDGKLLIGGHFTKVNGVTRQSVARLNADGTLDLTFDPGAGPDAGIGIPTISGGMLLQPDGKIIIYGSLFTQVNGVPRSGIARLNSDGSLDSSFDPAHGLSLDGADTIVPGTPDNPGTASAVVLQADGKIVVTGQFFFVITGPSMNVARSCVARFNSDGSFDSSYNPGAGLNNTADPTLTSGDFAVRQSSGKVIIQGLFDTFDGHPVAGLVRLNTNGSYDGTFTPGTSIGSSGFATGLFVQTDDQVIVFGKFTSFSGFTRSSVVRLAAANGVVDAGFNTAAIKAYADQGSVAAVAQQLDGKLLVGGLFHSVGASSAQGAVRLNTDGSRDGTFDTTVGFEIGTGAYCFAIRSSDNKIFMGGIFATYNGTSRDNILLANTNGSLDTVFAPSGVSDDSPAIFALATQSDGKILVGGFFNRVNGEVHYSFVRLNPDGSIDHTFAVTLGTYGSVRAMLIQPDGKIMIAGQFRSIDNTARSKVARLNSDGTIDATFDPGNGPDDAVHAMAQDSAGNTYIGGDFLNVSGTPRVRLAKLMPDGSLDAAFDPGTGPNNTVRAIAPPNGSAGPVIGGFFTTYNGATVNRIVRVDAMTGARDTAFTTNNGTGFNSAVRSLALTPTGQYLAGGNFSTFNGTSHSRVARLNSNGTIDAGFSVSSRNGGVLSLAQQNGKLFVGGSFSTPKKRIDRLLGSGAEDVTFNPGTAVDLSPPNAFLLINSGLAINAMSIQPDGKLLIGGLFNQYNGASRVCLARLTDSNLNYTAVSRKLHSGTPHDINLPLTGNSGIECRSGGATNDYQIVFSFAGEVTFSNAAVTSGAGTVSSSSGNGTMTITVNLTGVTNAQRITVTLMNVSDGTSTADLGVQMGVLVGDTNANGTVNASDVSQTKGRIGQALDATNFRSDVNANGSINATDTAIVKVNIGTGLP